MSCQDGMLPASSGQGQEELTPYTAQSARKGVVQEAQGGFMWRNPGLVFSGEHKF